LLLARYVNAVDTKVLISENLLVFKYMAEERMMRSYSMVYAALILAAPVISPAATPEQVGDYTGTFKAKIRTPSGQTSVKSTMLLSVAADDSTTITLDGVVQLSATSVFGPSAALIAFADPVIGTSNNATYVTGNLKNSVFKGTATIVTLDPGPPPAILSTGSAKVKLKKLP
jgi:hypothetical protein